jgi:group I intron endonuclease
MTNPFNCGVYRWFSPTTGKSYVGSSSNVSRRRYNHVRDLTKGTHVNAKLQNAWNKYGPDSFEFEMLTYCPSKDLIWQEQLALDAFDAVNTGYNIAKHADAPTRGFKFSKEVRAKLSRMRMGNKYSLGHKHSLESRQKMGRKGQRKPVRTLEHCMNLSRAAKIRDYSSFRTPEYTLAARERGHKNNPPTGVCAPYLETIETLARKKLRLAQIYHLLVDQHGFTGSYKSVWKSVQKEQGR